MVVRRPSVVTSGMRKDVPAMTRGSVVAVSGARVWVVIPRWFHDEPVGPFQVACELPAVGARVVLGVVDGDMTDLVVLGVVRSA